jgi:hypothetical protein
MASSQLLCAEAVALAGFFLVTQLVAQVFRRVEEIAVDDEPFVIPQAIFTLTAIVLSLIAVMTAGQTFDRLAGPLAVALIVPGVIMLANSATPRWTRDLSYAALSLGVLLAAELSWALVDPGTRAPWLHRTAGLLGALAITTIGYSFGLARILPREGRWGVSARQIGPVLGLIAVAVIVLIVFQDGLLFDKVT